MDRISRRDFLRVSSLAAAATFAAACTPTTAPPEAPATAAPTTAPAEAPTAAPLEARYKEAPMLAEKVAAGELPPVDERLPENPFVIEGLDGIGNYGGTMRKSFSGQADGGTISHMTNRGMINVNQEYVIHPYVAESWEVSEDAREYTFRLRKGLKWSDGAPMTADDFRYYYEDTILNRDLTPAHPEALSSVVDGERVPATFSAPDDYTVKYTFREPAALFYYWGTIILNIPASPQHYMSQFHVDYQDKDILDKMVADAGLEDWTQLYWDRDVWRINVERPTHLPWNPKNPWTDELVVAQRNLYFWEVDTAGNQLPYIDKVTFRAFSAKDVTMMWAANGEIDCQARHIGAFSNFTVLKENESIGDYRVQLWNRPATHACCFNLTTKDQRLRELFQERDFRIAVSLCPDRDEMRELVWDGFGINTQYAPPPDSPYYYPNLSNAFIEYDPDKANELLDGLGYSERDEEGYRLFKDGSGDRIAWTCLNHGQANTEDILMLTDYLKDIGLQMDLRDVDRALSIERHHANEVEMTYSGSMDRNLVPLADTKVWTCHTGISGKAWVLAWTAWRMDPTNPIGEKPPEDHWIWDIWAAYEELGRTADMEAQKQVFWKILDIWAEEVPCPGLYGGFPYLVLVKNGFKGIHEGYGWDCCTTIYEYIIDNATWYWDEPEKHAT